MMSKVALVAALLGFPSVAYGSVLFGVHAGGSWTVALSAPGVNGRLALPVFGLHGVFSLNRRIKLRSYLEYQRFSMSPQSALLSSQSPNAALSALLVPTYQMPSGVLGATYIGLGGGVGIHPSFDQSLTWATTAFGSEFGRKYFFETRIQFKVSGGSSLGLFDLGVVIFQFGFHLNPKTPNWRESLLEEKR